MEGRKQVRGGEVSIVVLVRHKLSCTGESWTVHGVVLYSKKRPRSTLLLWVRFYGTTVWNGFFYGYVNCVQRSASPIISIQLQIAASKKRPAKYDAR